MNPIALVTGASRGIGRATAVALAARGVDLVVTYRTHLEGAEEVVADVRAAGGQAIALPLDVADVGTFDGFVARLAEELERSWGRRDLDILVNNAGVGHIAPFAATSEADFDALMSVHVKGPFFLTQRLLPLLSDGASIVNVSTGLTRFVAEGASAYAAMKSAVETLTRYQAKELGARGIRVNVVAPGPVATDLGGGVLRQDAFRAMAAEQAALGRIGEPEDIGEAIAGLTSEAGRWITAQRIELSGGTLL